MKNLLLLFFCTLLLTSSYAQEYDYKFRLILKDKGKTKYEVDRPEEFLSAKSIERRKKQNINITISDLPISGEYINKIESLGARVVTKSKWLNSVSVNCQDSAMIDSLKSLPFVNDAIFVWKGKRTEPKVVTYPDTLKLPNLQEALHGDYYGWGYQNIKALNVDTLHKIGFKGKGIDIAVIDAGFKHLPSIELLDNISIKGQKSFVDGMQNAYIEGNQHGLNVLSCIAANKPEYIVGTAPEADFWLLTTEDSNSEFPIEEDYWVAAIEYADSVGVDVVNTSLGYSSFDSPAHVYKHEDLDGRTAFITKGANMAVRKGMFVVVSAGNSGDSEWRKITPPSDAYNVLTVGAIRQDSVIARFSSRGMTADLRVKPDVMTLGANSTVIDSRGTIAYKSGTSFSSPIMTGVVACLWQAYPELSNIELLNIIRESGHKYENPDENYGYGIPNMKIAMQKAEALLKKKQERKTKKE